MEITSTFSCFSCFRSQCIQPKPKAITILSLQNMEKWGKNANRFPLTLSISAICPVFRLYAATCYAINCIQNCTTTKKLLLRVRAISLSLTNELNEHHRHNRHFVQIVVIVGDGSNNYNCRWPRIYPYSLRRLTFTKMKKQKHFSLLSVAPTRSGFAFLRVTYVRQQRLRAQNLAQMIPEFNSSLEPERERERTRIVVCSLSLVRGQTE